MRVLPAAAALILITFLLQWSATGYTAEFSSYSDEPAHYVTGLMFTEYLRQGLPGSPVRFAEQFYLHYPKVAIGSWPPLFYVVQALWTLPLGSSKQSVYLLIACLTAAVAVWTFLLIRPALGTGSAFLLGIVFLLLPITQTLLSQMMADMLVTLLTVGATVFFARYWSSGRYRDAILYGLITGATILTKGSGVALTLIPICAIVLSRRWNMLLAKPLWLAAAIVVALGAPWTLLTLRIVQDGWQDSTGLAAYFVGGLWGVPWTHARNLGLPLFAASVFGAWLVLRRSAPNPLPFAAASTVLAVLVFHMLTPVGMESRRIFMAVPPTMILAAESVVWLRERMPQRSRWPLTPSIALLVLAALYGLPPHGKAHYGFDQTAEFLHSKSEWTDCVTLVSSEIDGEGMLISEAAVRENRPRRYYVRSSKSLASMSWNGVDYRLRFPSVESLDRHLDQSPVNLIVIDNYPRPELELPHHRLLWRTVEASKQWEKVASFSPNGLAAAISIFRHRAKPCVANPPIEADMTRKLQHSISNSP